MTKKELFLVMRTLWQNIQLVEDGQKKEEEEDDDEAWK